MPSKSGERNRAGVRRHARPRAFRGSRELVGTWVRRDDLLNVVVDLMIADGGVEKA